MRHVSWTDDELWRAIAHNTDTLSALLLEELKLNDSAINPCTRADLILFVNGQYRDYTAELRRRHHCQENSVRSRERKWFHREARLMKATLARLVRGAGVPSVIRYGIFAALVAVMIVGALSLRIQ
jgi:hypothetical protein